MNKPVSFHSVRLQNKIFTAKTDMLNEHSGKKSVQARGSSFLAFTEIYNKLEIQDSCVVSSSLNNSTVYSSFILGTVIEDSNIFKSYIEGDSQIDIVNCHIQNCHISLDDLELWIEAQGLRLPEILPPLEGVSIRNFSSAGNECPLPYSVMRKYLRSVKRVINSKLVEYIEV